MAHSIDWKRVTAIWRASGRTPGTIDAYSYWARRYVRNCVTEGRAPLACLTRADVTKYSGCEIPVSRRRRGARLRPVSLLAAVRALWCALTSIGHRLPPWRDRKTHVRLSRVVQLFVDYRLRHHGVAPSTAPNDAQYATLFLDWLRRGNRSIARIRVVDVDAFVTECSSRWAPKTVAGMCSSLRAFLRHLHATGRISVDLASCVVGPRIRWGDRPPRTMAWDDVRRILRAINTRTNLGRRDLAMFMMMAMYGMGAGEVLGLRLDDFDWRGRTMRVRRPKTGTVTMLPLLAPVARAVASYVRKGRPTHSRDRAVFVSHRMPHTALTGSSAIHHRLAEHATTAGVAPKFLGTHAFRHTHATRQIEGGVPAKIIGEILGHRRPESTSAYVRSAIFNLRAVSLPVPR
jgi:integrase/recombinase XerD